MLLNIIVELELIFKFWKAFIYMNGNGKTLEEKQELLREEILDKHYNVEEFVTFFQEKKGDDFDAALSEIMDEELIEVSILKIISIDHNRI